MCNIMPSRDDKMYHMTHIDNVESIIQNGLMSRNALNAKNVPFEDVADVEIISKRHNCIEDLANFVLFHFDLDNAFDYNVCRRKGCNNMVILAIARPQYWSQEYKSHAYIFPTHPIGSECPQMYSYDAGYRLIRWDILDSTRWNNDPVVRKSRMAECVVDLPCVPINLMYVASESTKQVVLNKLARLNALDKVDVIVRRDMFPNCA